MMFWIFIYWLLCAFIVIGTDDGEPWTVGDKWYIVFAGFYVPIIIGLFIGSYIKETGFFDKITAALDNSGVANILLLPTKKASAGVFAR